MTQLTIEFDETIPEAVTPSPTGMVCVIYKLLRPYRGARWRKPAFDGDLWLSFIPHPVDEKNNATSPS